jgi:hypothetical protein
MVAMRVKQNQNQNQKNQKERGWYCESSYISRSFSFAHLWWGYCECPCRADSHQESHKTYKQIISVFVVTIIALIATIFFASVVSADTGACKQERIGYYCEWNGNIYPSYAMCFNNCYARFGDVVIHTERSKVEFMYLSCGIILGVLFISAIIVGLK